MVKIENHIACVEHFKTLLDEVFKAAPYLQSIAIKSVGSHYVSNYDNYSELEHDTKSILSMEIEFKSVAPENLSVEGTNQLETFLEMKNRVSYGDKTNITSERIISMLKSREKKLQKLIEMAALESKIVQINTRHSLSTEYVFSCKQHETMLLNIEINAPIRDEKENISDEFKKELLKL